MSYGNLKYKEFLGMRKVNPAIISIESLNLSHITEHHPLDLFGLFISAFLILTLMGCVSSLHGGKIPEPSEGILMPGYNSIEQI